MALIPLNQNCLTFSLKEHKQNAPDVLDAMQICCNQILCSGDQDNDLMLKVLNALETSDNKDFLSYSKEEERHLG